MEEKVLSRRKVLDILSLFCNILIIAFVAVGVIGFFIGIGPGNMAVTGTRCFMYFTTDSNLFLGIIACICLPFNILILSGKIDKFPKVVSILKMVAVVQITITFLVAMCFLGPVQGFDLMLAENNIFLHLLCPILAIFSYLFCENGGELQWWTSLFGILPAHIYGVVYTLMVQGVGEANGGWKDFYNFFTYLPWYVSMIGMCLFTVGICFLIWTLHKLFIKKVYIGKENQIYKK